MIFVLAPGTHEMVPLRDLFRMRLPLRHGWDGWVHKDKATGRIRRFKSYRGLRTFLKQPAR